MRQKGEHQVTTSIARRDDPDTREEERLKARIEELRSEIATATAELQELRTTLAAFDTRYDARIGTLIVQLDRLTLQIAEYERRLASLSEPVEAWQRVEEEIARAFHAERERVEYEEQETRQAGQRARDLPPEPSTETRTALKSQYYKLARRYHPDVAKDGEERIFNESAMRRINAAFEANDLDALQRLVDELPTRDEATPGVTIAARIAWLASQIGRLEQTLAQIHGDVARIKAMDRFRLWEKVQADRSLLDRLEATYREEIETKQNTLSDLMSRYMEGVALHFTPESRDT